MPRIAEEPDKDPTPAPVAEEKPAAGAVKVACESWRAVFEVLHDGKVVTITPAGTDLSAAEAEAVKAAAERSGVELRVL